MLFRFDRYSSYERMFILLDKNKAPFDLSGYEAKAQIRKYNNQNVVAEFSCNVLDPATSGRIILTLDYTDTANTDPGKYSYDILLISPTERLRAVEGMIELTPNITED